MTTQYRGPWNYAPDDVTQRYVYNDDGGVVCKVDAGNQRADSDGVLIASAPDLLEACLRIIAVAGLPLVHADGSDTQVLGQVRDAISKALGR